ncbi:MAG TPA: LuxR family transcriptional regulator, partial [Clostridia bacterium]|nr:LuxR family transcriptional regulator [Clostridia bacterium]
LLNELQHSKSSGVFLILDATVNPHIQNAENSRAGLFLKNMEATAVSSIYYNIRYMRGPASIGRSTRMTILPQWKMEFDVRDACYFKIPMATVAKSDLSLSRLYYWCPKTDFDDSDSAMLCSVPLIASDGTVLGVAGFEMSSMLFRLKYTPNNSSANRLFCMLAPSDSTYLQMKNAMFAGSYSVSEVIPSAQMTVQNNTNGLNEYLCNDNSYFGLDNKVRLYAANSPYEQEEWSVVLLAPKEDIAEQVIKQNRSIVLLLVLLTAACVVLSIRISRKYLRPVRSAFDTIKLQKVSEFSKTRIPEIDDLIQYLAIQDEKTEKHAVDSSAHDTAMFETFVDNIKKLSMAERAVFDLYLEGHTAKEIAQILCLSINTIKTHNRRIYMKLNVTSRKELLVYTHMMQELAEEERFSGTDGS